MMGDAEKQLAGFKSDRTERLPKKVSIFLGIPVGLVGFLNVLNDFESKVMGFRCICNFISFLEKEKALLGEGGMFNIPHLGSLLN